MKNKKDKILRFLKKNGMSATGRIAMEIGSNQWMAKKYLEALEEEKLIEKNETPIAVYWTLKGKTK